jgi:beta-phosphoglucomutase
MSSPPAGSSPRRKRLAAACFDLDGVLIDTMPQHAEAWRQALAPLGVRVPLRDIYAWEGESGAVTARTLAARSGRRLTPSAIRAVLRDKERRFQALASRIRAHPILERLLRRLAGRGIPLALVTGTSAGEVRRVLPARTRALFDAVVTGDRVRRGKPHPEPYRVAARRLGVSPRRTLVVENAPYGIRSARRAQAGVVVALASSLPPRHLSEAHRVVRSVKRLCALVESLLL